MSINIPYKDLTNCLNNSKFIVTLAQQRFTVVVRYKKADGTLIYSAEFSLYADIRCIRYTKDNQEFSKLVACVGVLPGAILYWQYEHSTVTNYTKETEHLYVNFMSVSSVNSLLSANSVTTSRKQHNGSVFWTFNVSCDDLELDNPIPEADELPILYTWVYESLKRLVILESEFITRRKEADKILYTSNQKLKTVEVAGNLFSTQPTDNLPEIEFGLQTVIYNLEDNYSGFGGVF